MKSQTQKGKPGEECGPNLLKINTPQYQHLVWHVLVISFSPLSVSVLGTAEKGFASKEDSPTTRPSLLSSFFPSQIRLIGGGTEKCEEL